MNSISYLNQVLHPSKVVCIGRNYTAHIEELNNQIPDQPVVFVKPNSAVTKQLRVGSTEPIHYESEISFLIIDGQLNGVAFGLDLTKRQTQTKLKAKGLPWERAKAFDGAAVFSDFVNTPKVLQNLRLELEINGQLRQKGGVNLMLNKPLELVAEIQAFMSFEDGDILMTGTPSGVGIVSKGDVFVGRIFDADSLLVQQQWRVED
jgi:2-keto-4-pentenoate hydratase/2-oxohepta-3-ene-1,7-dioic acid hydratase in catechol pathway